MSKKSVSAFWIANPGMGEIRTHPIEKPREGEVGIKTLYSAISRGTESLVFNGNVPISEFDRMRAPFQEGNFPGPVKYGYINVGIIDQGPEKFLGKSVFCLYPHQTYYVVPEEHVYVLPDNVPEKRAVLTANMEAAVNGLWDATPKIGDRITIVGGGILGFLFAWLTAPIPGCAVEIVDTNTDKAPIADALNIPFKHPSEIRPNSDLVIHTTGTSDGLSVCLQCAGFEAKIIEMSWFGNQQVSVPLGEKFHSQRLTLQSSQVSSIPALQQGRWSSRRRMELALRLLSDPDLDALITGESHFDELPNLMQKLAKTASNTLCHRIKYTN
ncbi:MAG: dehydrogenase [Rhodospirillaceae bacterium]|nr:dehydrogenase [Rhodospirillaceae bacterium]